MRIALAFALAACARSTPPPALEAQAPEVAEACDLAAWQQRATSPRRGRIAGAEVIVAAEGQGRAQILARIGRDILVGTDISDDRFEPVVVRETGVARAPGGPWLPGVTAEPGLPATGSGAWLAVHSPRPVEVEGVVPRDAAGATWRIADAAPAGFPLAAYADVLAAPAFGAEQVASITGGDDVVDRIEPGPPGWLRIEAHAAGVRVVGWTQVPHPSPLHNIYDFSDDTIEGDLVRPDASPPPPQAGPGCIRAHPRDGAAIVGVVTGTITSRRVSGGWLEIRVAAPWGRVVGYVRAARP